MEITYEKSCRVCLKDSRQMFGLFELTLHPGGVLVTDFIEKMTEIKIIRGEYLPDRICDGCNESVKAAFCFAKLCIESDELLKKEETRREFRKIEEEALHDDTEIEDEIEEAGLFDEQDGTNKLNIKSSEIVYQTIENGISDISDASDQELGTAQGIFATSEKKDIAPQFKDKYKCSVCSMMFSNKGKFLGHQKTHDESKPFKCHECFQSFLKEVHLNVHLRSHAKSEQKKYGCKICGQHFMFEYLLKQHEFKHSDVKPYPCRKCDKGCLTSESLRRHMKVHEEDYSKKAHLCSVCRKEFSYPSALVEHMKLHTGEKPYLCPTCGKGFRQIGTLHYHQRTHTGYKPFKCGECQESFMSQSRLKVHLRKHTNERPYVCDVCGMAFRQSADLKSHTRTHSGEKSILCPLCGKRMSKTGQLTVHLRSHTGEKPYSCATCSRAFTTRTMLTKHERIHTGERPYVCHVCGKAFSQSSTLRTHSFTHSLKVNGGKPKQGNKKKIFKLGTSDVKVDVKEQEVREKTEFLVISPAPIPLLTNLV